VDALPKMIAFTSLQEFNLSYKFLARPQRARLTPHRTMTFDHFDQDEIPGW